MADYQSIYAGKEVDRAIAKLKNWASAGFDITPVANITSSDTYDTITINGVQYATIWHIAPTNSNDVYGYGMNKTTGRLYQIHNNNGAYTAIALDYAGTDTVNTAGSKADSAKLYLIGTKTQEANEATGVVTYTSGTNKVYAQAGELYSNGAKVLTAHPAVTTQTDTTSTASPSAGGNFTVVDSVTRDGYGHVTKVNTKTVTLPSDSDTKVTQAYSTANNSYPVLLTNTAGITSTNSRGATTSIVNNQIYANPSTGSLYAKVIYKNGSEVATLTEVDNKITALGDLLNFKGTKTEANIKALTSAKKGDVWLDSDTGFEWVCITAVSGTANAAAWEQIGKNGAVVIDAGYEQLRTGYSANGKNYAIQKDANNKMYVNVPWTDNNTTYSAGTGLTLSGTQFSVSQANASTILNLLSEGTSVPQDNDYYISQYVGGGTSTTTYHRRPVSKLYDYVKTKLNTTSNNNTASWGGTVTVGNVGGVDLKFTMPGNPNTNTATAADNILDGSNSGTQITYAPYTAQQDKLSFDTSTTNPARTGSGNRLNLNGDFYATKLYDNGNRVITDISSKAPNNHASSATTYGVGTTSNYGHVKLATGDMNGASNADGVAVSKNHTHSQYIPRMTYEVDSVTRPTSNSNYVVYHITAPEITALTDGLTIRVHKSAASNWSNDSTGAVKLLQINSLDPIALFWRYNSFAAWTNFDNVYMTLTYSTTARPSTSDYYSYTSAAGFILDYTYDSGNDCYTLYDYGPFRVGNTQITSYSFTGFDVDGNRIPLVQGDGTLTDLSFVYGRGIQFYDSSTRSANTSYNAWSGNFYSRYIGRTTILTAFINKYTDLKTVTPQTRLYFKCELSGITMKVKGVTITLPSSNDGYYYMYVGHPYTSYTNSTSNQTWSLPVEHPIYYYDGGLKELSDPTSLSASKIPNLGAGKITSGTFDIARIPTGNDATHVSKGNHIHSVTATGSVALSSESSSATGRVAYLSEVSFSSGVLTLETKYMAGSFTGTATNTGGSKDPS